MFLFSNKKREFPKLLIEMGHDLLLGHEYHHRRRGVDRLRWDCFDLWILLSLFGILGAVLLQRPIILLNLSSNKWVLEQFCIKHFEWYWMVLVVSVVLERPSIRVMKVVRFASDIWLLASSCSIFFKFY